MFGVRNTFGIQDDMPSLGSGDVELHIRASLSQPYLQRSGEGGCGAGGNHANDKFRGSAHRPDRTRRLTVAEITTELGFAAKPIPQRLKIAVPATHTDTQICHLAPLNHSPPTCTPYRSDPEPGSGSGGRNAMVQRARERRPRGRSGGARSPPPRSQGSPSRVGRVFLAVVRPPVRLTVRLVSACRCDLIAWATYARTVRVGTWLQSSAGALVWTAGWRIYSGALGASRSTAKPGSTTEKPRSSCWRAERAGAGAGRS